MSLECKPASWMKQGSTTLLRSSVDPGGWLVPFVGRQVPSLACCLELVCRCCAACWGRDLKWDLPHTYSCTYFYSTKQRWKQARTLPIVNSVESKLLLNKQLQSLIFFYFIFTFYFILLFYVFFMAN